MIRFTLAPVPRRKAEGYFVVTIHPDRPAFQQYLRSRGRPAHRGTIAAHLPRVSAHDAPDGHRKPGYLGEMVFWERPLKTLSVTLVSHELMHAVLAWAWRDRLLDQLVSRPPGNGLFLSRRSPEERICHAMSAMTQQFVREGYKRGIWP